MDTESIQKLAQVSAAYREKAEAELARRREADALAAAGAAKTAAALVAGGALAPERRAKVEAALRDPVKAQGMVASLAEKLAVATQKLARANAAPDPIGAPDRPAVKAAAEAAGSPALTDARWAATMQSLRDAAAR